MGKRHIGWSPLEGRTLWIERSFKKPSWKEEPHKKSNIEERNHGRSTLEGRALGEIHFSKLSLMRERILKRLHRERESLKRTFMDRGLPLVVFC